MSNILDQIELDGLRADFFEMLGMHLDTNGVFVDDDAKTSVIVTRITDMGAMDPNTGLYPNPVSSTIYTGPAHVSPVTFRRDRQEIGGMEAVRIRQYRAILPWDSGDIWIDDLMTVSDTQDPQMIGKTFEISDVLYESELGVRRISLTDTSKDGEGVNC